MFAIAGLTQAEAGVTQGEEISFIQYASAGETLQGVDGNTSSWSADGSMANLGTNSWSLLGGTAWVNAYRGDDDGILTHRGTRGLGIFGAENDEIDSNCRLERLEIAFNQPQYLNSFEVRSLYVEKLWCWTFPEKGIVDFYLEDNKYYTQLMTGVETGGKGIASFVYGDPYVIDKLVFYVPDDKCGTRLSEFSVAKLNVTATPEPVSSVLFLIGGASLVAIRRRRKGISS
jgi:hypothetical protein